MTDSSQRHVCLCDYFWEKLFPCCPAHTIVTLNLRGQFLKTMDLGAKCRNNSKAKWILNSVTTILMRPVCLSIRTNKGISIIASPFPNHLREHQGKFNWFELFDVFCLWVRILLISNRKVHRNQEVKRIKCWQWSIVNWVPCVKLQKD